MKRALFDTVTVLPFASGNVVDRIGYESAVLAVTVEASQTATIKVETADSTAGPYEPVKDSRIFVDNPVNEDGEAVIENEAEAQAVANLDIDLIGCKPHGQHHGHIEPCSHEGRQCPAVQRGLFLEQKPLHEKRKHRGDDLRQDMQKKIHKKLPSFLCDLRPPQSQNFGPILRGSIV